MNVKKTTIETRDNRFKDTGGSRDTSTTALFLPAQNTHTLHDPI